VLAGELGADAQRRQLRRSDTRFDKKEHGGDGMPKHSASMEKDFHCKVDSRCGTTLSRPRKIWSESFDRGSMTREHLSEIS